MNRDNAANKVDEIIKILLANQEDALGKVPLLDPKNAVASAQALAAFRKELIDLIEKQ